MLVREFVNAVREGIAKNFDFYVLLDAATTSFSLDLPAIVPRL